MRRLQVTRTGVAIAVVIAVIVAAMTAVKAGLQVVPKTKVVQIPVLIRGVVAKPIVTGYRI